MVSKRVYYAPNTANPSIYRINSDGTSTVIGTLSTGKTYNKMAFTKSGRGYMVSSDNQLITFTDNPFTTTVIGTITTNPTGITMSGGDIAFDGSGNMWLVIADTVLATKPAYLMRLDGPIPTTASSSLVANKITELTTLANTLVDGIAFDIPFASTSNLYISTPTNLYKMDAITGSILTTTPFSPTSIIGDIGSCMFPEAVLDITKSVSPTGPVNVGSTLTYSFNIHNSGNFSSTSSVFKDILPANVSYVANSATVNGVNINAASYPFATPYAITSPGVGIISGYVAPNIDATISFQVTVNAAASGTTISNTANLAYSGNNTPGITSNTVNSVVPAPPTLGKSFSPNITTAGGTSQLTLTIGNSNSIAINLSSNFNDIFPTSPSSMTVSSTPTVSTTCKASDGITNATILDSSGGTLATGDVGVRLAAGSIIPVGGCTISVNITVIGNGAHVNTTSSLVTDAGTASAASATLSVPIGLSGFVYEDLNVNGTKDGTEMGTNNNFYVKLQPNCTGNATAATLANTTTGAYSFINIPTGNYCIILDNNNTLTDITPNLVSPFSMLTAPYTGVLNINLVNNLTDLNFGVAKVDTGDAPASYGLAAHDPAAYTPYLGANYTDTETYNPSSNATSDNSTGTDDEDSLSGTPSRTLYISTHDSLYTFAGSYSTPNTTFSLTRSCQGNGTIAPTIAGWIDFDGNGTFDVGERASATCSSTNTGTYTLNWTNLTLTAKNTFIRLRIANDPSEVANPVGGATSGEVEDHPVEIGAPIQPICQNTPYFINDPAKNFVAFIKGNMAANTADTSGPLAVGGNLTLGTGYSVNIQSTGYGIGGTQAKFNTDYARSFGTRDDLIIGGDLTLGTYSLSMGYGNIVYGNNIDVTLPTTKISFSYPTGSSNWESIRKDPNRINFNSAFLQYQSLSTSWANLPTTGTIAYPYGGQVDLTVTANGVNIFNINAADVNKNINIIGLATYPTATVLVNVPGSTLLFNKDVLLDGVPHNPTGPDADIPGQLRERVLFNFPEATTLTVQGAYIEGSVFAPFVNTFQLKGWINGQSIIGGNVEQVAGTGAEFHNYCFTGSLPNTLSSQDRGDAPISYGSARHTINSSLYLGTLAPDNEISTDVSSPDARGDDILGLDDEDAFISIPTMANNATSYTLNNVPVFNNTGTTAKLYAWIDLNRNGTFETSEGVVSADIPSSASAQTTSLTWPSFSLTTGTHFLRLRLTNDTNVTVATPSVLANNGETEDYLLPETVFPATITKDFDPTQIAIGESTTVNIVVSNPNALPLILTSDLKDIFPTTPSQMSVAPSATFSTTCKAADGITDATLQDSNGGTLATGDLGVSLPSGSIIPVGNCVISVEVTASTSGTYINSTSSFTTNGGPTGSVSAGATNVTNATLQILIPPTLSKAFSPNSMTVNGVSRLTVSVTNPNAVAISLLSPLDDVFPIIPSAMVVAATPNVVTTCKAANGTTTATIEDSSGGPLLAGDVGMRLPINSIIPVGGCTISIDVTASSVGTYTNTTSNLTTLAGISSPATANLVVGSNSYDLSGFVYNDLNAGSTKDGSEDATGLPNLYAKLFNGTCAAIGSSATTPQAITGTGAYSFSAVPAGNYCVVINDNNTPADSTSTYPTGWTGTENNTGNRGVLDINLTANTTDQNFGLYQKPTLTISKISNGGTGTFAFTGTNGVADSITTTTAGSTQAGTPITLTAVGTATEVQETAQAGWTLTSASCTAGSNIFSLSAGKVTIPANNVVAGANITCTFTNDKLPTITIAKQSNGGTDTFAFTGTNGVGNPTITTVTAGTAEAGTPSTITAFADTTVTETAITGWNLTSVACTTDAGATSVASSLSGDTVTITEATLFANAGKAIACTFTNDKPTYSISGNVYNDLNAGSSKDGSESATGLPTLYAKLFNGSCLSIGSSAATPVAITGTGAYSFGSLLAGNYCVVIDNNNTTTDFTSSYPADWTATENNSGTKTNTITTTNIADVNFGLYQKPTVTIGKISNGGSTQTGTGSFDFTGNNGILNTTVTTTAQNAEETSSTMPLNSINFATTITETIPTGWVLSSVTCKDGSTPLTTTLSGSTVTVAAADIKAGANITCTFTNNTVGKLKLDKAVRNVTAGTGFGTSANGKPNDVLEYKITYTNIGGSAINNVKISDAIPAYTTLKAGVYSGNNVSITCPDGSTKFTSDNLNIDVSAQCASANPMAANASGSVMFQVTIKN